jgi:ribonuclease-3
VSDGASDLAALERALGYTFADRELLSTALTHRSYANEHVRERPEDNERFEFLGDAVLGLVIGELLLRSFPHLTEGQLSVSRGTIVSEEGLSQVATDLGLGKWIRLGKGEDHSGGRAKPSILADALEALIGAVYLDGGFEAARHLVHDRMGTRVSAFDFQATHDFKTQFQEMAQARLRMTPEYRILSESGPDHEKVFEVCVLVGGEEWARASGKSKKLAEQRAAELARQRLEASES